ncbi:MAG: DUF3616 domain-containing protein [Burkholderiaceae bacterium]
MNLRPALLRIAGALCLMGSSFAGSAQDVTRYTGRCDASAAIALDAEHFAVANDEVDTLSIYRRGVATPSAAISLSHFLGTPASQESDIEGAAAIGTRVYWITSHGRNSKGKHQPSRHRIFATEVRPGQTPTLEPLGTPYVHLLRDLEATEALRPYQLGRAAKLAAEADGGLNIEGLAATPSGQLLIGFRNPLPGRRALIVPLENPTEIIEGMRARLGSPIELDLGGRGIRSIELIDSTYLIVAGPTGDNGTFAVFRWSGKPTDVAVALSGVDLQGLRPEALFAVPNSARVQLLSDDGGVLIGGVECKSLPATQQAFRSLTVAR